MCVRAGGRGGPGALVLRQVWVSGVRGLPGLVGRGDKGHTERLHSGGGHPPAWGASSPMQGTQAQEWKAGGPRRRWPVCPWTTGPLGQDSVLVFSLCSWPWACAVTVPVALESEDLAGGLLPGWTLAFALAVF